MGGASATGGKGGVAGGMAPGGASGSSATGGAAGAAIGGASGGSGTGGAGGAIGVAPCKTLAPDAKQVQFTADGGHVLVTGEEAASVIDTSNWTVKQLFPINAVPDFLGVISGDGTLVATLSIDNLLRLWSVGTGAQLGQVAVTKANTSSQSPPLAFSPDASRIVAVDAGYNVRLYNRSNLTQAWTVAAGAAVGWIGFSADGQTVLATVQGQVLRLDAGTGKAATPFTVPGATGAAAMSGDGKTLAVATSSGMSTVRVSDGTVLHSLTRSVGIFALSYDGAMVATTTGGGAVGTFDTTTGAALQSSNTAANLYIDEMAFSPDGSTLAVAADNLVVWRISDGSLLYEGGGRDRTAGSPTSDILASASVMEAAFVWDLATGAFLRRMPVAGTPDFISTLTFESGGDLFVDARSHGEIWDLTQGAVTDVAYAPADEPPSYSGGSLITPDGKWIVSGGDQTDEGAVRVWSTSTGTVARSFPAQGVVLTALVIDPSGTWLATTGAESVSPSGASQGFDIKVWDFASGTLKQTLTGHTNTVFYLAFSPDGKSLLSGGGDGLVRLWSVVDGSVIRDFAVPPAPSATPTLYGYGVAVSPDGRFVASGAQNNVTGDEFVDVWSTATGQLARRLALWGGNWWMMSWSPDGQYLVTNGPAAINVWCVGDLGSAP
jgi:WD40 repeat protein